jgi:hypothetical protein
MSRWLIWLLWPAIAGAQQAVVAAPDASVSAALANLSQRAAIVFVGQVVDIRRNAGVVEIQFRVDTLVLGQTGGSYTLREWSGMWPPGQWRYGVGERALVFLHGTSAAGLSSAVDGGEGVVPVMADTDGTVLLDVRRLSTRVLRQVGQPLSDGSGAGNGAGNVAGNGAMALKDALPLIESRGTRPIRPVRRPLPPGVQPAPPPSGGLPDATGSGPIMERLPDVQ